jgi:hypothetical protein
VDHNNCRLSGKAGGEFLFFFIGVQENICTSIDGSAGTQRFRALRSLGISSTKAHLKN